MLDGADNLVFSDADAVISRPILIDESCSMPSSEGNMLLPQLILEE